MTDVGCRSAPADGRHAMFLRRRSRTLTHDNNHNCSPTLLRLQQSRGRVVKKRCAEYTSLGRDGAYSASPRRLGRSLSNKMMKKSIAKKRSRRSQQLNNHALRAYLNDEFGRDEVRGSN